MGRPINYSSRKDTRIELGMTQLQMAYQLKVSRSLIALYERGKRSLPDHASEILRQLRAALESDQMSRSNIPVIPYNEDQIIKLKKLLEDCEYQLTGITLKIRDTAPLHEKAAKHIQACDIIINNASENNRCKEEIDMMELEARKPISKKACIDFMLLKHKQKVLIYEKALFEEEIRELEEVQGAGCKVQSENQLKVV